MGTDGILDEGIWDRVVGVIKAAHGLDRASFVTQAQAFAEEVALPGHQQAGLYLGYLLRNALGGKVGGRVPTDAELHRIARDYVARFFVLVDADEPILEDTFRKAFERAPLKREISPGEFLVLAHAALGVLYQDPDRELSRMKPHLTRWWQRHVEKFHSQGLLR